MTNHTRVLPLAAAAAAGALFMYYLDSASGARRRALARDKLAAGAHDAAAQARRRGKHAVDRMNGAVADRRSDEPAGDEQLQDRIRSRAGHLLSRPKALHVEVDSGRVCLKGDVAASELDRLLTEVQGMPGVKAVRSELTAHATAEAIPHGPANPIRPHETQEHAQDAWNEQGL